MEFAAGFLYAVVALIGWGIADFLAKNLVDRVGSFNALLFDQLLSIAILAPLVYFTGWPTGIDWGIALLLLANAMLWIYPYIAFYKAYEKGLLSVVTPIAATWGAGGAILAVVFLGETLTLPQWASIAVIAMGIFLISTRWNDLKRLSYHKLAGVNMAVLALIGWSGSAMLAKPLVDAVGPFYLLTLTKMISIPLLVIVLPLTRYKVKAPFGAWKLLAAVSVFNIVAFLAYNYGMQASQVSIVGPVAAAFPIITVTLAWLVLKEKLDTSQKLGVALTVLGMIALAL
jgi:drug/metabolite transporter (DMT)-like permease